MKLTELHERLERSSKWWIASRAVILKTATLLLSCLLALKGKDPDQAVALVTTLFDQIGTVVGGAGGVLVTLIALEDIARNLFVTTPKDVQTPPKPEVKP